MGVWACRCNARHRGKPIRHAVLGHVVHRDRERELGIRQIELVHHLVVVVPGRRRGCRKPTRIRRLEEDDLAVLLVEHRVVPGVIERVVIMSDDLASIDPRPERGVRLQVPVLAQQRRAHYLRQNHHPAASVRVPLDRRAVIGDRLAGLAVLYVEERVLGLHLPVLDQARLILGEERRGVLLPIQADLAILCAVKLRFLPGAAGLRAGERVV